jgi:hypothetical protein
MRRKRTVVLVLGLLTLLSVCTSIAVAAHWQITGSGNGYSKAAAMPTGSTPTKSIGTYPAVALNWSAATVGAAAVDSYTVRRYTEAGALQTITANCSGAITAITCTENATPVGRWQYTTQAKKGTNWLGVESAKSSTVEIAAAPTAASCSNCHTFSSSSYINAAGKTSITVQVTLAASSLATDTVHLTLTDSAVTPNVVTAATQAATAGAGTITFSALNTTTLIDGNVTAKAWVTANTSDASPNTTKTLIRDTVAPSASDIQTTNGGGGTALKIDAAGSDTMTYTFSEPMDPATIMTGWSGTSTTVTATVTNATSDDTIGVTGASFGTVNTNTSFTISSVSCTASTLVMSGSAVTLTLNTCAPTSKLRTGSASTFNWAPVATPTDQAGNPMSTTTRNETGGPKANF